MAEQIIKQPNGLYAIWSTCVDNFTVLDATEAEIVDDFVEEFRRNCETEVRRKLAMIEAGRPAYHQFSRTFDECVETIRELHGDDNPTLAMIEQPSTF